MPQPSHFRHGSLRARGGDALREGVSAIGLQSPVGGHSSCPMERKNLIPRFPAHRPSLGSRRSTPSTRSLSEDALSIGSRGLRERLHPGRYKNAIPLLPAQLQLVRLCRFADSLRVDGSDDGNDAARMLEEPGQRNDGSGGAVLPRNLVQKGGELLQPFASGVILPDLSAGSEETAA